MNGKSRSKDGFPAIVISKLTMAAGTIAMFLLAAPQHALAQHSDQSGKDVVESVCVTCHGTGLNGSPKIGDKKAWSARAERGLTSLSKSALNGIRKMPSHGGNPGLSDDEITRAIIYMVNESGGSWVEPINKSAPSETRSGEQIVHTVCFKCHETGLGGAPKIGDRTAWAPRLNHGIEALSHSAINGHGGMPPRGGVASLTDVEIKAAIAYMWNPDAASVSVALAPVAKADPNHQIIDGMEIYFGVASAESLRKEHPGTDQESTMHSGIPRGDDYYHLNISLVDAVTKTPIKDAHIEIRIDDPTIPVQIKTLEPMAFNNTVSYGNYFVIPSQYPHMIDVLIRKTGTTHEIETKFEFHY
jgi:cytochrome c5